MLPEVLINHNPILVRAQGLAQLGVPRDVVAAVIAAIRVIPLPSFGI